MAYRGLTVTISLGQGGLRTDDSQSILQPTDLISATNVNFNSNLIEKDGGSTRFNTSAITDGIYGAFDWWPTQDINDRKLVVVGGDGKVYAIDNAGAETEITASGGAPATLSLTNRPFFLACGKEVAANNRKLFIFNGVDPVQIIDGTATIRTSLGSPPADWSGSNQPKAAFLHRGAVYAFGNVNRPHFIYRSSLTSHADFSTAAPVTQLYSVYPGEGDSLQASAIFRGKPLVMKSPWGLYALEDSDVDPANWYFARVSTEIGASSPHSVLEALNDILLKSPSDSVQSLSATLEFGDIKAGDVLSILNISQFIRDNTDAEPEFTQTLYYPENKTAYFTYRSAGGTTNDRMLGIRIDTKGSPRAFWITKDAPNCMCLRRDTDLILRPVYGSLDGYVYLMDQEDRNVNDVAYLGEFQTPHLDFGFVDARIAGQLGSKNKIYDYLEMRYYPQGNYSTYVDVYIDQEYSETLEFVQEADDLLADVAVAPDDFMLAESATDPDGSFLAGDAVKFLKRRLNGSGRTISFRVYNAGLNESFKIAELRAAFRASGQQEGRA